MVLPALEGLWLWFSNICTDSPTKRIFSATRTGMYEGSISTRRENCCRDGASIFSSSISLYKGRTSETLRTSDKPRYFSTIFFLSLSKRLWTLRSFQGWGYVYIPSRFKMRQFISTVSTTSMDFNRTLEKVTVLSVKIKRIKNID